MDIPNYLSRTQLFLFLKIKYIYITYYILVIVRKFFRERGGQPPERNTALIAVAFDSTYLSDGFSKRFDVVNQRVFPLQNILG